MVYCFVTWNSLGSENYPEYEGYDNTTTKDIPENKADQYKIKQILHPAQLVKLVRFLNIRGSVDKC